jgi:tRNA-specific 2-thiouridylase
MSTEEIVVAAMSGGVDSSVAAALLVRQGVRVIGVTLRLWPDQSPATPGPLPDIGSTPTAAGDARAVADHLGIPHHLLSAEAEFERQVIQPFVDAYLRGETPSPCLGCNARLKFGWLGMRAQALGASIVATGHYAQVDRDPIGGRCRLLRGADPRKDQSYFLSELTQTQLSAFRSAI